MNAAILSLAMPLLVGPITFAIMQGLKTASATIDALNPWIKRGAVAAIAVGLTLLGKVAGISITCDPNAAVNCLTSLDNDTVKALVSAGLAYGLHLIKPKKV